VLLQSWNDVPSWWTLAITLYGLLCLIPVWSDMFRDRIVPDAFTYPLIAIAALMLWVGPGRMIHLLAFLAALLGFHLVTSAGKMGGGDLKLILPLAALSGANFLMVIYAAFVCSLPFSLRASWLLYRRRKASGRPPRGFSLKRLLSGQGDEQDESINPFYLRAPFGPGAALGAHLVWFAMGLPLWSLAVWAVGWIAMLAIGLAEQRTRPHASPARVRDWAMQGRTGDLDEVAGRPVGWLQKKAIMQSLLDDEHWQEAHLNDATQQPLGEQASALTVRREGQAWQITLSAS
jgi:Flp pilus assembly protein protease CpaA